MLVKIKDTILIGIIHFALKALSASSLKIMHSTLLERAITGLGDDIQIISIDEAQELVNNMEKGEGSEGSKIIH